MDAKLPSGGPPALVTRMSTWPSVSVAFAMNSEAPPAFETSPAIGIAPGSSAAVAARRAGSRPLMTTLHPASSSALALPRPSPADDAATTAHFPAIPKSMWPR